MNITTKISTARQSKVHKYWKNGIGILELAAITALPIMPKFIQHQTNGIAPITKFDASETGITLAGEVKDFPYAAIRTVQKKVNGQLVMLGFDVTTFTPAVGIKFC